MATTKLYLDTRRLRADGTCPLTLGITHRGKTARYNLGITLLPSQWDARTGRVLNHPSKASLNAVIAGRKNSIDNLLLRMADDGELSGLSAVAIKERIVAQDAATTDNPSTTFEQRFRDYAASRSASTRTLYLCTMRRIEAFCPNLPDLRFEDITKQWLVRFEAFLALTAPSKNARNIHLRNIRAVFNSAIDDEITTAYPFRQFKIRAVPTRKRSLPVEDLRRLFAADVEPWQRPYLDLFKLIFMLIGINSVDLHRLTTITRDGRIEYERAKTHRLYSVKVEPEALEIINKYRGVKGLTIISDRYSDHHNFTQHINKALQSMGKVTRSGHGGKKSVKPMFPGLTTYWARHSWATIAASLDIPKETIAHALGHGSNTVTDIYIDFDQRKVDEANRRVIDWVLYGKR